MSIIKLADAQSEFENVESAFGEVKAYGVTKFVPLTDPVLLQLPTMTAPFGFSQFDVNSKLSMPLNVSEQSDQSLLTVIDTWAMDQICMNSVEWLGRKNASQDYVEAIYTPLLKPATNARYSPTFKLTIPDTYKHTGVTVDSRAPGTYKFHRVTAIVQIRGLWVASGKCGLSTQLKLMQVEEPAPQAQVEMIEDDLELVI